jgi:hypothetical protein
LLTILGTLAAVGGAVAATAAFDNRTADPAASSHRVFTPLVARDQPAPAQDTRVLPPPEGVYHSAFPDFDGTEDVVTPKKIADFAAIAGKGIAWAYFSDNWIDGIRFPAASTRVIHDAGVIPFIRMMPRSNWNEGQADPVYRMQSIIDGRFDPQLTQWARDAKAVDYALMVEFGTEVNGDWFPWNGRYNGGDPDGPRRFRDAYRHIIDIFRREGVSNITWVFHVDAQASPRAAWNAMRNYYPGDDYIDWLGISVYGAQTRDEDWQTFTEVLDSGYAELAALSLSKPIALLEFAVTDGYPGRDKAAWIRDALAAIRSGRYARIKAVSYWHENYTNDGGPPSLLRIDTSPAAQEAYRTAVADPFFVASPTIGVSGP